MQNERADVDQVSQHKTTAFELFGFSVQYHLNLDHLDDSYYEASRKVHPDHTKDEVELCQILNGAYETLKDTEKRALLILALHGVKTSKVDLPHDLAEAWFDLKMDPEPQLVLEFERSVQRMWAQVESSLFMLWQKFDAGDESVLTTISNEMAQRNYLKALRRDVESVKGTKP
jgi:curved DNA-binding protein CbpA